MTEEVYYWIVGMSVVPILLFAITSLSILRDIKKSTDQVLAKLHAPHEHGLGTAQFVPEISKLSRAIDDLAHYTEWLAHEVTGRKPPPPGPGIATKRKC